MRLLKLPDVHVEAICMLVDLDVRVFTPDYRPAAGQSFIMKVERRPPPGQETPPEPIFQSSELRTDEHGRYLHTVKTAAPGIYDVEVRAVVASRTWPCSTT